MGDPAASSGELWRRLLFAKEPFALSHATFTARAERTLLAYRTGLLLG